MNLKAVYTTSWWAPGFDSDQVIEADTLYELYDKIFEEIEDTFQLDTWETPLKLNRKKKISNDKIIKKLESLKSRYTFEDFEKLSLLSIDYNYPAIDFTPPRVYYVEVDDAGNTIPINSRDLEAETGRLHDRFIQYVDKTISDSNALIAAHEKKLEEEEKAKIAAKTSEEYQLYKKLHDKFKDVD